MANANSIYAALSACGFESSGNSCFGTWKGYAVSLRPYSGRNCIIDVAIRAGQKPAALRKGLAKSVKGLGVKKGAVVQVVNNVASFTIPFGSPEEAPATLASYMNAYTAALRENGVAPADTCAITGASRPDSLCLVRTGNFDSYQPVSAAAVRRLSDKAREAVEENQLNGSYGLGVVGALLGMLVGLIPNLLTIVFTERIFGLLFALVPILSMLGYKLFRGKMSKGAMAIVILLSLLGVPVMEFTYLVIYLIREYGAELGEAVAYTAEMFRTPEFLSEAAPDFIQLLVFMAIGVAIAWRFMSGQINTTQLRGTETQLATLRPNPAYAPTEETNAY